MATISPIAFFRSPFPTKFGIPRQSGVVEGLRGTIEFVPRFRSIDALRGIEGFDYLWLIWGFSANEGAACGLTVRPPRLGGNRRMGVFATRSPFRPNGLGLSSVRLVSVDTDAGNGPVIHVSGADLMDNTPIYDIKPYVAFTDSHATVRSGFVDGNGWQRLRVDCDARFIRLLGESEAETLLGILSQDPRPHYHDDPSRVYGMPYGKWDVRFTVCAGVLRVVGIVLRSDC